ncbi:MAG: GAF domain-containing sensor histidine kinase [Acidimicrobiia bacterium]
MDAIRVDVRDQIHREARYAGLRDPKRASVRDVEQRRFQLWVIAIVVLVSLCAVVAVVSWSASSGVHQWVNPTALRVGVIVLALGFGVYALEKEVHLHRLVTLLSDERVVNATLANRFEQLQSLIGATKAVNSVLELDEVLDLILRHTLDMLDGVEGSIMLLEGEDTLRAAAVRGSELARHATVKLGESIAGKVARTREPLLLNGEVRDRDFPGHERRERPVGSAMVVPLVNRGELLGVLSVNARAEREFVDYDLHVLSLFAEAVAAAIANARLYEAERAHVAELLELDRMKTQFVASVSHELRTPLTSIRGAVTASRRTEDLISRDELLDVVDRQSQRLHQMVEEMLQSAQMDKNHHVPLLRSIDLAALVRLVALDSHVAGRPVKVEAPQVCEVRADPEAMRRIVGNLIDNAHKYGATPVRVVLEPDADRVILSVVDSGPGVPPAERSRIFDRFYRADPTRNKPGLGLGLPIVRGLVDACGGSVWVEDAPGGGAAFRVALKSRVVEEQEVSVVR